MSNLTPDLRAFFEHDSERMDRYRDWCDAMASESIAGLVARLNREVGGMGWGTARADYLHALHRAFDASGYDCSDFLSPRAMSLKKEVCVMGRRVVQQR